MPTPVLVESPALRPIRHIHLLPPCAHASRPSLRKRLHLQPRQPLLPELVPSSQLPPKRAPQSVSKSASPQQFSLLALTFAASAAPMLWLLHAAGHAIHLF